MKLPRDLRQTEVIVALIRLGGWERKGKGSHRVVTMSNGKVIVVPHTVKVGMLRSALRTAGCTTEEFLRALGR